MQMKKPIICRKTSDKIRKSYYRNGKVNNFGYGVEFKKGMDHASDTALAW